MSTKKFPRLGAALLGLLLAVSGCADNSGAQPGSGENAGSAGKVAILLPEDSFWGIYEKHSFDKYSYISKQLAQQLAESPAPRFAPDSLIQETAGSNEDMAKKLDDLLQRGLSQLVISPFSAALPNSETANDANSPASDPNDLTKLQNSLKKAAAQGVKITLWGAELPGVDFQTLIPLPDAEAIGRAQAQFIVQEKQLTSAETKPQTMEILLSGADRTRSQEYFAGVWEILQPFFEQGKLVSKSNLLNRNTNPAQLEALILKSTVPRDSNPLSLLNPLNPQSGVDAGAVKIEIQQFLERNYKYGFGQHPNLDILLAPDDYLANTAKLALTDWRVSPADWPEITGYGGLVDSIVNITNSEQAMTIIYNSNDLIHQTAQRIKSADQSSLSPAKLPIELEVITQTNLMNSLIKPGYITAQDAGL